MRIQQIMKDKFVVEARTEEEANSINLEEYRFERFSESKGVYIFIKRGGK